MNSLIQLKTIRLILVVSALGCFALLPRVQAVNPPPDGGYPGGSRSPSVATFCFASEYENKLAPARTPVNAADPFWKIHKRKSAESAVKK